MRHNGVVASSDLAPRRTFGGVVAVWIAAAVGAVVIGIVAPPDWRAPWLIVALGGSLLLAFAIQLSYGRSQGFTQRVAGSVLGALLVLGVISLGFGLADVVPG